MSIQRYPLQSMSLQRGHFSADISLVAVPQLVFGIRSLGYKIGARAILLP